MERIPILFLIDVLYARGGGAEGVLWKMVRHLPADRYDCSIATLASYPERVAVSEYPCPVHRFPIRRTYDWQAFQAGVRLARLVRSQRIRITHTFFPASDLFGGAIARLTGCPIIISSRRDMGFQRSAAQRLTYRLASRRLFDQVHAVADSVRRWHIEHDHLDPRKVITVYNGVDLEEIDAAPEDGASLSALVKHTGPVIVCVANIRPVKATDMLVRTAAMVCRDIPSAKFLVLGAILDTAYMEQVTELAKALNVSRNVVFAGPCRRVFPILKACDVFYMPSRSEGLSNAILEAMGCELPVVATETGGNAELVENHRNGYVTPVGDPASAARRILDLLTDAGSARNMGQAGRRIVEARFSVQAMIDKLTGLYEGLLARQADAVKTEEAVRPMYVD